MSSDVKTFLALLLTKVWYLMICDVDIEDWHFAFIFWKLFCPPKSVLPSSSAGPLSLRSSGRASPKRPSWFSLSFEKLKASE